MKGRLMKVCLMACFMVFAGTAAAQEKAPEIIRASDVNRILEIAKGFGNVELEQDKQGDPKISGMAQGKKFVILFYGCDQGKGCKSISFYAGWKTDNQEVALSDINQWNSDKRFGRMYLDESSDPILQMDVEMENGMTRENLEEVFRDWASVINSASKSLSESLSK